MRKRRHTEAQIGSILKELQGDCRGDTAISYGLLSYSGWLQDSAPAAAGCFARTVKAGNEAPRRT
jgi:hypothetical protein